MAELPSGTVTLLFTDIEGSTKLVKALGDDYGRVLSDHRALLRRAFNLFGGQVVDRQGDAFFVVFRRAKDAVSAAAELQRALHSHPWPTDSTVRVRVGVHTGEPSVSDEGLTGFAVHVASRICSAARGGQILISNTTHDLVEDELPPRTALRGVGEHRLKDIDRPAHLFEVVVEELEHESEAPQYPEGPAQIVPLPEEGGEPAAAAPEDRAKRRVGVLRAAVSRRFGRASTDHIGARIHSMSRISPSPELASALRALGGAILQSARDDRDAEKVLKSLDRRALRQRLHELRSSSFLTERDAQVADGLAMQLAALDCLASLRPKLHAELARIETRTKEIRHQVFAARLGHPLSEDLVSEINNDCQAVQSLRRQLQRAKHEASRSAGASG
jgi:class 3 adenylate cyclase